MIRESPPRPRPRRRRHRRRRRSRRARRSAAASRERGIEHVVLERGEVANAWRHERWDSLRLLTPNWQSRLPGYRYGGTNPDGFMTMPEVVDFIDRYARRFDAPVQRHTNVTFRSRGGERLPRGHRSRRVVVRGHRARERRVQPAVGSGASQRTAGVGRVGHADGAIAIRISSMPGGVLVVGASASGVQLADEIRRSGRDVWLAVGEHIRLPRTYRGRDIQRWMRRARRARRALRRRRRHRQGAPRAVAATRRHAGAREPRPERIARSRRAARRTSRRYRRRQGAVLRFVAQSLRDGGSEDDASARSHRRAHRAVRRRCDAVPASVRPRRASTRRRASVSTSARDPHRGVGHRLPARLQLARRAGARRERSHPARRRRGATRPACTRWGCRSCAGANRASSTAPKTTRAT